MNRRVWGRQALVISAGLCLTLLAGGCDCGESEPVAVTVFVSEKGSSPVRPLVAQVTFADAGSTRAVPTGADGKVVVDRLKTNTDYTLTVVQAGYDSNVTTQRFHLNPSPIRIELVPTPPPPPVVFRVKVVRAGPTSDPVDQCRVRAADWMTYKAYGPVTTGADGVAVLPGDMPAGRYYIETQDTTAGCPAVYGTKAHDFSPANSVNTVTLTGCNPGSSSSPGLASPAGRVLPGD